MRQITYPGIFWLFMLGNILGVLVEGVWCKLRYGKWETHTVAMWGPFNIVYGIGVPVFHIGSILLDGIHWLAKFSIFALLGSVVEYTDNISLYMDAADLYLTKPGGISVTEAAVKNLPMVFVDAVAGCEEYNMEFFLKMKAAATASTPKDIANKSLELLRSPSEIAYMKDRLQDYRQPNGAARIYVDLQNAKVKC